MKRKIIFFLCLCMPFVVFAKSDNVKLSKCIDGDTAKFILKGEEVTVRFLGIDTPEIKHAKQVEEPYGNEAKDYTCNVLTNAKKIKLEYDDASKKTDNYNRYLAWIWTDDTLLQKSLIKKGYAKVAYVYGNYKYIDLLKKEEEKIKAKHIGIWSDTDDTKSNESSNIDINYPALFVSLIIVLILCLLFPKYRKKTIRKTKKKIKKRLEDELEKNLDKI